jgi:hypothetical protein
MAITCIGRPVFDFKTLQEFVSNPRRYADAKIKFNNTSGLLAVLAGFEHERPLDALRNCGSVLKHVSYTFLLEEDTQDLRDCTDLQISTFPEFSIVTGTLKQFRDAALECCQRGHRCQNQMTEFVRFFMNDGLVEIFSDTSKTLLPSGALILKRK